MVDALEVTVSRPPHGAGPVAHSDRGSQYAGGRYRRISAAHGICCSMSRRADCRDDAPIESLFASPKKGLVHGSAPATRAELFEYIEVLNNRIRRHSSLGYRAPDEDERVA